MNPGDLERRRRREDHERRQEVADLDQARRDRQDDHTPAADLPGRNLTALRGPNVQPISDTTDDDALELLTIALAAAHGIAQRLAHTGPPDQRFTANRILITLEAANTLAHNPRRPAS